MHEWLLAIHETIDTFKKKMVGTTVATQTTNTQVSSVESDTTAEEPTRRGRVRSSSPSGPASSSSSVTESTQNDHSAIAPVQNGHAMDQLQSDRDSTERWQSEAWGSTDLLDEEEEQGSERGNAQIKRRSLVSQGKRNSRHLSPPRDPPPPPPNDNGDPPDPSSETDLLDNVDGAMDEAFNQVDSETRARALRRRPHSAIHFGGGVMEDGGERFSTFKPDSLSQPSEPFTGSSFRRSPNLPSFGRRWKVVGEGETSKMKPIETAPPQVPTTYQEADTSSKDAPATVSVYSDDFVEHHHSLKRSHRRKMSAPANLLLDEPENSDPLPYLPMRHQRSYGDLHSITQKPLDLSSPVVLPPPPPLPPRTPTNPQPEVTLVKAEATATNQQTRQASLRKMVSKDFLAHLTAIKPFHHQPHQQQQQQKEREDHQRQPTARENGHISPVKKPVHKYTAVENDSYETVVNKELAKVSINEIKQRLFGDSSNLMTSPIPHMKPAVQAPSPVAQSLSPVAQSLSPVAHPLSPVAKALARLPEVPRSRLHSEDSERDGLHTPIQYARESVTPSIARNPKYGEQYQGRADGASGSDSRPQSAVVGQPWQNGHTPRAVRDHTPSQPYNRDVWASSSQTLNDFRFNDTAFSPQGPRPFPYLQQHHRTTSNTVLSKMPHLKGRITSLDSDFVSSGVPMKAGWPQHNSPRAGGQARYSPKASSPGEGASRAPKQNWPYIRGSGQNVRANVRPNTRSSSQPAVRDTPGGKMALSVFDTMVEWDETSNTTILRSTC